MGRYVGRHINLLLLRREANGTVIRFAASGTPAPPMSDGAMAVPMPAHDIPLPAQQHAAQRQARRQALHTQVWALRDQGWTAPAIAQQVGVNLRTVQRDLQSAAFAGRKRRRDLGDSVLNPYMVFLLERWNAG